MNTQTAKIEDLLDEHTKQTLVANAWLVAPGVRYQDVAELLQVSDEHARRTFRQLEAGDIEIDTVAKPAVQTRLGELLSEVGALTDAAGPVGVRTDREEVPEWWQDGKRAPPTTEPDGETSEAALPGTAKERLLAAWHIITDAGDDVVNRELAAVADCSEEHARRTRNAIEANEIEDAEFERISDEVWDTVSERLVTEGVMDSTDAHEELGEAQEESVVNDTAETVETVRSVGTTQPEAAGGAATPSASFDTEGSGGASVRDDVVPARDVRRVRDILDALRREAETAGDVKATFVANEAVSQLTELLNNTETDSENV